MLAAVVEARNQDGDSSSDDDAATQTPLAVAEDEGNGDWEGWERACIDAVQVVDAFAVPFALSWCPEVLRLDVQLTRLERVCRAWMTLPCRMPLPKLSGQDCPPNFRSSLLVVCVCVCVCVRARSREVLSECAGSRMRSSTHRCC